MGGRDREPHGGASDGAVEPAVLELAREIHAGIRQLVDDPAAHLDLLDALIEGISTERRLDLARTIFEQLPVEQQWAVLERVYGDDEIRAYLDAHRASLLADAEGHAGRIQLAARVRKERRLDTRDVDTGEELTLGLFREHDVRPALARGHTSSTCARRLVLRAVGDGRFQVMEDTFNPRGGYFVTADYSEDTWQGHDRLEPHAVVRVGSIPAGDASSFEPVVYPGGRVDVEMGGAASPGRLHLGFAMLSELDVFRP
ncbi:MAG: hypothetical protein ACJ739_08100 [Acidimicrobiales bacterium]